MNKVYCDIHVANSNLTMELRAEGVLYQIVYPDNLAMKLSSVYTYRLCLEALKKKTASTLYLGKQDESAPKAKKEAGMF